MNKNNSQKSAKSVKNGEKVYLPFVLSLSILLGGLVYAALLAFF